MNRIDNEVQGERLTSSETGHLWNTYMVESIVHHIISYFAANVDDPDIKDIIELNIKMTKESLDILETAFKKYGLPVPRGAKSGDVNINAPRLYSDIFYMNYFNSMSQFALLSYGMAYSQSNALDVKEFFWHYLNRLVLVARQVTELMQKKGIYIHPPYVSTQDTVDFVKDKSYAAGFLVEKRPLTVIEISTLFQDAYMNSIGKALLTGFIKTAKSDAVKQYFIKGRNLANKYYHDISKVLSNEGIPGPPDFKGEVTKSTIAPFSDMYMLLHSSYLSSFGISAYGKALSSVQRHDLTALYVKIAAQVGKYANDAMKLMIENGWLEQPPTLARHERSANTEENDKD